MSLRGPHDGTDASLLLEGDCYGLRMAERRGPRLETPTMLLLLQPTRIKCGTPHWTWLTV